MERFAYVDDAESLAKLANQLGFPLSQRTAHRIIKGEIKPLPVHLEFLLAENKPPVSSDKTLHKNKHKASQGQGVFQNKARLHSVSFDKQDLERFKQSILSSYKDLADAYYLDSNVEPTVTSSKNSLVVNIPLVPSEFRSDS